MNKLVFTVLALLFVSACQNSGGQVPDENLAPRTFKDATIHVHKRVPVGSPPCVGYTKSIIQTCSKWRKNEACFKPGNVITWKWTGNVDRPFKIVAKPGFTSPFVNDASCTGKLNEVICTVKAGTTNSFYEYSVVVDDNNEACNLDPRILIYE